MLYSTYSASSHQCQKIIIFIRHFIKIPFLNKEMDFIALSTIFRGNSVQSSIPNYFKNCEVLIVCYSVVVVVVVLLFYVHGKHLRSCRDGQLT